VNSTEGDQVMAELKADPNPIIVDKELGETEGTTTIYYMKDLDQELWERMDGGNWSQKRTKNKEKEAEFRGKYDITLKPGQFYDVAVFQSNRGPLPSADPSLVTELRVFCLWKKPEVQKLITDGNSSWGGTWYSRQLATNVPTNIVTIGVSRIAPEFDGNGIPFFKSPDGAPTAPLTTTDNHFVEIKPLFAGNDYFFAVVVADVFGNWEVLEAEFTTFRRKITVEFPTIHIYNDGDPSSVGEGEFWFRVYTGETFKTEVIHDFHLPTQDIDDWNETDRPYAVGFAHLGSLEVIEPKTQNVGVSSWGIEHDGIFDSNEGAGFPIGIFLPIPAGQFVENVTNSFFRLDCPTSTVGDDFRYGVDVRWSIEYRP
jgi:hypothetical protein